MGLVQPQSTVVLQARQYQSGTRTFPATPISADVDGVEISIDRTQLTGAMSDKDSLSIMLELSTDGGVSFQYRYGLTAPDGEFRNRDGTISTISKARFLLPEPKNPNRMIRGTVVNTTPVRISATVTVF